MKTVMVRGRKRQEKKHEQNNHHSGNRTFERYRIKRKIIPAGARAVPRRTRPVQKNADSILHRNSTTGIDPQETPRSQNVISLATGCIGFPVHPCLL
jgi:hypothetical protein